MCIALALCVLSQPPAHAGIWLIPEGMPMQARGAIAQFMGHIEVQPEESNYRLTPGLWLVSTC